MTNTLLYVALLVLAGFALRGFLVPYLLGRFTPIRIQSVSLRNIRGIEWHPRRRHGDSTAAPFKLERLGWEWCPRGCWGIGIVAEQLDLSIQHDLKEVQRMGENSGNAHRADPTGLSRMVSGLRHRFGMTSCCAKGRSDIPFVADSTTRHLSAQALRPANGPLFRHEVSPNHPTSRLLSSLRHPCLARKRLGLTPSGLRRREFRGQLRQTSRGPFA